MPRASALLQPVRKTLQYYLVGLWRYVNEKQVFIYSQAIAFKALVTIVPVLVLVTGVLARLLRSGDAFATVSAFLRDFLPLAQSDQMIAFLGQLQGASGTLTLLGGLGLLLSAVTLFSTLRAVLTNVIKEDWHVSRPLPRSYLFDLRMVVQVGLLFLLTVLLSFALQTFNVVGLDLIQRYGGNYAWMRDSWKGLLNVVGLGVPLLLSVGMFFQLYFFVPVPRPRKRGAALGAIVAALLWEIGKVAFTFYVTHLGPFEHYRNSVDEEGMAALGDTFALIIAFVFWIYLSGLFLIIGALVVLLHDKQYRGRQLVPNPDVVPSPL